MRRLGFNIKEYKWIFTGGQQGTWSNWRSNLVQIQEFYRTRMPLAVCEARRASDLCGWSDWKKKVSRGVYCRPASGPGLLKHLRTWGGWPLLSGMEKNHTASKMDMQKMEKNQECMCFVVFRCQTKKGSNTFFEPFFHFARFFFIARGNISRTTRMASGFSLGPWPLVSIHWRMEALKLPIIEADGRRYEGYWSKGRMVGFANGGSLGFEFFFPKKTCDWLIFCFDQVGNFVETKNHQKSPQGNTTTKKNHAGVHKKYHQTASRWRISNPTCQPCLGSNPLEANSMELVVCVMLKVAIGWLSICLNLGWHYQTTFVGIVLVARS